VSADQGDRALITVDAPDSAARGVERGRRIAAMLPDAIDAYDRLFAAGGIRPSIVHDDALRALDVVAAIRPPLADQMAGIADGAGVELWRVAALNARTEILARSRAVPPGECSTIVRDLARVDGSRHPLGIQTWDWHVELRDFWHLIDASGAAHRYVGLTEYGILAKIGVNSAGVALHFNILGHREDGVGGIPMHVLAALVLEEAESAEHAEELIRSVPVASSGSFLVFDAERAVLLDLSPVGVFEAPALLGGTRLRTNHFRTDGPRPGEKDVYQPDSCERYGLLAERLATAPPDSPGAFVQTLVTGPGEAKVTCLPDFGMPLGQHWASLATVLLDPVDRTARVLDGTPAEHATHRWYELRA
jgi:isopenicillin-N N-acyltransferase-like protein